MTTTRTDRSTDLSILDRLNDGRDGESPSVHPLAVPPEPASVMQIVHAAIQSGRSPEELREIMAFAREMRAEAALAAYNQALAKFKKTCPKIIRRTENPQFKVTRNGVQRNSLFASRADLSEAIDGALADVGLSYDWTDADTVTEPGKMRMGCTVRHADGHVAPPKFVQFPLDTAGAGSSPQQKVGSVLSYCMRYSLTAALGLTACDDDDDDGAGGSGGPALSDSQVETILNLLVETKGDGKLFAASYGAATVAEIPAKCFGPACDRLNRLRNVKAKQ